MKFRWQRRHVGEFIAKILMYFSFALVIGSLGLILWTVISKGLPALTWDMVSQTPKGGFYLGKEGGILNAIIGSLYMAGGGTLIALVFSLPLALYLETYLNKSRWGDWVRLSLDVLWGIPSIVYGAFGFTIMLSLGMRASLLGGIIVLALLELPIMTRAMDEVIRRMPRDLEQAALALGSTKLEVATRVVIRQMMPGIVSAILLAFGRGIGDAASVLFTAGYTDRIPSSLMSPAASLPLAVFFQLGTPFPEVQQRAYASALILTIIVLAISLGSRWLSSRVGRHTIK
ncbi:MAG: phosphate ABC transporter, permease protein PstA [Chloroflexi bacterium HGW-Chloroflexi-6]|nr:MAG: phosphate ABC transporter, permease protein PstA [Chloroflexi bacterium HGW-Chloroflexi-6]